MVSSIRLALAVLVLLISPVTPISRVRRAPDDPTEDPATEAPPEGTQPPTVEDEWSTSQPPPEEGTTSAPADTGTVTATPTPVTEESTSAGTTAAASTTTTTVTASPVSPSTAASPTPSAATSPASSPSTAGPTVTSGPPDGTTRGPTNITCDNRAVYAKPNETVIVMCTVFINPSYMEWAEWMLEVFFKATDFHLTDAEIEAARVAGVPGSASGIHSYPARAELVFSMSRDSTGSTYVDSPDKSSKYTLEVDGKKNQFLLKIRDVDYGNDGTLELVLRDKMHAPMVTKRVFINLYKRPDSLDVVAPPTAIGKPYEATCTVRNFFPPRSAHVLWVVDGKPIRMGKDASQSTFWWMEYPGGISLTSTLRLWAAKEASPPPNIYCYADWRVENVHASCNSSVTPKMYRPPEMSIQFRDGFAVCYVDCAPRDVSVAWTVNGEDQPPSSIVTEKAGLCKTDPLLNNLRSRINVYDSWGKARYSCKLHGYRIDGKEAEVSKIFDSAPIARGKPIIAILVIVFGVALVLGLIILSVALCFYKASGSPKYTRFYE